MVDRLTLDTNVLYDYWCNRSNRSCTEELLRLAHEGLVELAISAHIHCLQPASCFMSRPIRGTRSESKRPPTAKSVGGYG